jgi:hypothetical protein
MPTFPPKQAKPIPVMTGARHVFMIPDPPCIVIPIDWGSHHAHAQAFQHQFAVDVFVDGERVSHAVSLAADGMLEVAFKVEPGEYEVMVKEAALADRQETACAVLFASQIRVNYPGADEDDESAQKAQGQ